MHDVTTGKSSGCARSSCRSALVLVEIGLFLLGGQVFPRYIVRFANPSILDMNRSVSKRQATRYLFYATAKIGFYSVQCTTIQNIKLIKLITQYHMTTLYNYVV